MIHPSFVTLADTFQKAKSALAHEVGCPVCHSSKGHIRWGHYRRYLPGSDQLVRIQRYYCLNPQCMRLTFAVLPHPFLPIMRWSLCQLWLVLHWVQEQASIARIAGLTGRSWAATKRAIAFAARFDIWFQREAQTAPWMPSPCLNPTSLWPVFTRSVSWAFFPRRL